MSSSKNISAFNHSGSSLAVSAILDDYGEPESLTEENYENNDFTEESTAKEGEDSIHVRPLLAAQKSQLQVLPECIPGSSYPEMVLLNTSSPAKRTKQKGKNGISPTSGSAYSNLQRYKAFKEPSSDISNSKASHKESFEHLNLVSPTETEEDASSSGTYAGTLREAKTVGVDTAEKSNKGQESLEENGFLPKSYAFSENNQNVGSQTPHVKYPQQETSKFQDKSPKLQIEDTLENQLGDVQDEENGENDRTGKASRFPEINLWKYVCLGVLGGLILVYLIAVAVRILDVTLNPNKSAQPENFIQSFERFDNLTKQEIVSYILENYSGMSDVVVEKKNKSGPGANTTHWIGIENSFENINHAYRSDKEIELLMTSDNLHQVFHSLAYAPKGVMEPQCGVTQRDVILDVARLSMVTNKIRTYGTQCNQAEYILKAIQDLGVNMTLSLGVWVAEDDYVNWRQMDEMKYLLKTYPRDMFDAIFVGNEVLFREDKFPEELVQLITEAKNYAISLGYADLPVGTSELGSLVNEKVMEASDFFGINIHPFFGGVNASSGTNWVLEYYKQQVVPLINPQYNKKIVISEVGWPYKGGSYQGADATPEDMQKFLNDWICKVPQDKYHTIYFEAFNEPWKSIFYEEGREWETEWGFFTEDRKLKPGISLPICD
ncbi:hypothetical protein FOA43_003305 [Brettanomyces nanus]|uniref:glucan endo-1,3-beta-D-glucosidase n=1 Tax=Eeniella nana TaxID=13502 RepID=A0A875S8A2_EENNA|nr:uncharacterized protein FOA43_003305 [Brettanomyces nanus]QPG75919.1 hypothetical protein FOA43_003305 [Brettanomyces nanus]